VPKLAEIDGITIIMHYREHPPPHFHARRAEREDRVQIDPIGVINGNLPARQRRLVLEWAAQHQEALIAAWQAAQERRPLPPILQ
jgi:hypothetical protein